MTDYRGYWNDYARRMRSVMPGGDAPWPGDEWATPGEWRALYEGAFAPHGARTWRRAVEIGSGSGKYTKAVLDEGPHAELMAFDVSEDYLALCAQRLAREVEAQRLHLVHLAGPDARAMLSRIEAQGWRGEVDAVFSIDAMVHVDLQYLIVYILTAGLVLKPGGFLILTLADPTTERGFETLLGDIYWTWPLLGQGSAKFEWVDLPMVRSILERLGFALVGHFQDRDLLVVATLADPERAQRYEGALRPPADPPR